MHLPVAARSTEKHLVPAACAARQAYAAAAAAAAAGVALVACPATTAEVQQQELSIAAAAAGSLCVASVAWLVQLRTAVAVPAAAEGWPAHAQKSMAGSPHR
jgi:hypothetical protein